MTEATSRDIRRAAIDLLARREYSFQELIRQLSSRFSNNDQVNEQIQQLANEGLQCDQRYVETYVRSKIRKGHGPLRLINELKQKGIPETIVIQLFKDKSIDWYEQLHKLSENKYGNTLPLNEKEKAKRIRFFQYRGFDFEQIKQIILNSSVES